MKGRGSPSVVSLDLDGTLVDKGYAEYFWMELMPRLYAEAKGIQLEEARAAVYSAYDEVGRYDARWYSLRYWIGRFGLGVEPEELIMMSADRMKLYPDAEEAIGRLRGRYVLVAMTNSDREFAEAYDELLGLHLDLYLSCVTDFGMAIKSPEFYRNAVRRLRVEPEEVVHVGDDPVRDLQAALDAGLDAYLVDRSGCGGRPRCVDSLSQLADSLDVDGY